MRFAIDAHAIGRRLTGNEVYVRNLLAQFAELSHQQDADFGDAEFLAYLCEPDARHKVPARMLVRQVSRNPFVRLGVDLPRRLRQDRPDILHVQYTAPLFSDTKIVVTVHDVSFLEHPEFFSRARAQQLRFTVGRTVERAEKILCVSDFSRQRLMDRYGLTPDRVAVTHNAVSEEFRVVDLAGARQQARQLLGFDAPFLLTVGDLRRRKNPLRLLAAFEELLHAQPDLPHHLVYVGKHCEEAAHVLRAAHRSPFGNRIHFTGFVPDEKLVQLYNACDAFVFPSLYEGFGIPVIEAMACGCVVACSGTSALPEVAGGAARLFDPYQVDSIAGALHDITMRGELRQQLSQRGLQRARQFSWRQSAARNLEAYYQVAGQPIRGRLPVDAAAANDPSALSATPVSVTPVSGAGVATSER